MPTVAEIRNAIVATINTVAGIGQVSGYERYAKQSADMLTFYRTQDDGGGADKILGWHVRRVATREISPDVGRYVVDHDWQIRGFMSLVDAEETELAFDALIEAVRDAFRDDDTLGGVVDSMITDERAGVQVSESVPVMFAGVLCHSARLSLTTRHYQ